jgi:hypothetical protein
MKKIKRNLNDKMSKNDKIGKTQNEKKEEK